VKYLEWNDAIASHLFRPGQPGERVFLYVTDDTLASLGPPTQLATDDFLQAVRQGPQWTSTVGVCRKALEAADNWRARALEYPPYIAYLALFVLAAGLEGDFAPHAYYPRLRTLLGEPPHAGQYPGFPKMLELWEDLESWSMEDKVGELGIFRADFSGGWIHVGVPIAQALLTEEEHRRLPEVFVRAALDPTSTPTDNQLATSLLTAGPGILRSKVLRKLSGFSTSSDDPFSAALLDLVRDELAEWDGFAPTELQDRPRTALASLKLTCRLDRVAGRATFRLRARSAVPLPPDGLILADPATGLVVRCQELAAAWSTELVPIDESAPFDASLVDWENGLQLVAPNGRWSFRLQGRPIRLFISGSEYGLPGLVEESSYQSGRPFILLVHPDHSDTIGHWGVTSCRNFEQMNIGGLSNGWRMYTADGVYDDSAVRSRYPMLALPRTARLTLEGGIRSLRGNTYYSFAPPKVKIEETSDTDDLTLFGNQHVLSPDPETRLFALPGTLESGSRWILSLRKSGEEIARKSLYILDNIQWPPRTDRQWFDRNGHAIQVGVSEPAYTGPDVRNFVTGPTYLTPFIKLAHQESAYLLGRRPGQVSVWMHDPPQNWQPVWAVIKSGRRRLRVQFCGCCQETEPISSAVGPRQKVQLWRELLWHSRRRAALAIHREHRELWRRYQEVARNG
jgi:hypothetical protein